MLRLRYYYYESIQLNGSWIDRSCHPTSLDLVLGRGTGGLWNWGGVRSGLEGNDSLFPRYFKTGGITVSVLLHTTWLISLGLLDQA